MENVDIQDTGGSEATSIETPAATPEAQSAADTTTQPQAAPKYVPFAQGKEKFKIHDRELEWDWDTTKRYAQKGYAGMQALERAAQTEKAAKDAYNQLLKAAESDPEGLLEVLNPKYKRKQAQAAAGVSPTQTQGGAHETDQDPRDLKIQELEQKYQSINEVLESQKIAEERKAIATELDEAVKQFPVLDDPIYREHVKAQYRRHLQNGIDVSIEDVAFHVAQQLEERKIQSTKAQKASLDEKRRSAPVTPAGAGSSAGDGKPMTREEVMRLAGRV
jgi:hypothetical protein